MSIFTCTLFALIGTVWKAEKQLHTITNGHSRQVMELRLTGLRVADLLTPEGNWGIPQQNESAAVTGLILHARYFLLRWDAIFCTVHIPYGLITEKCGQKQLSCGTK
jgi:hypothetical protein